MITIDYRQLLKPLLVGATLTAALVWAYWTTLGDLARMWSTDPQYSHGFLVPVIGLAVLWKRRTELGGAVIQPSWYGIPLLVLALVMFLAGSYFYSPWLESISLLPAIAGACWALGGWGILRAAAPAIAFLVFMLPLPGRVDVALASPLRQIGTLASTNILQTLGFFAQAEGNVILLPDYELGIVEACSGLRMMMTFLATSAAVAVFVQRSMIQRLLILASAIPLAILCNVIRITSTAIVHETAGHEIANYVYHDLAGWLMPLMALGFLWLELLILNRLFVPVAAGSLRIKGGIPRLANAPSQA
jgi:exosortase